MGKMRFARSKGGMLAAVSLVAITSGCAHGITHSVRPGENLYRIAQAYGREYEFLARINRIRAPYTIKVGDELFIPDADRQLPVNVITPKGVSNRRPTATTVSKARTGSTEKASASRTAVTKGARTVSRSKPKVPLQKGRSVGGFAWPVKGAIAVRFGKRGGGHHDGIDIKASMGTRISASQGGTVIYSDRLSGYGNVIILEHSGGFTTVYAHNRTNLVRLGSQIEKGQAIAEVGDTGRTDFAHLHFEVRKDNIARNPEYYLR